MSSVDSRFAERISAGEGSDDDNDMLYLDRRVTCHITQDTIRMSSRTPAAIAMNHPVVDQKVFWLLSSRGFAVEEE
jgi:hypothetical protein